MPRPIVVNNYPAGLRGCSARSVSRCRTVAYRGQQHNPGTGI